MILYNTGELLLPDHCDKSVLGRFYNPVYMAFFDKYCQVLDQKCSKVKSNFNEKNVLKAFDYDFRFWPVDYAAQCSDSAILKQLQSDSLYGGRRAKVKTLTGAEIDTMFLDRRDCHAGQFLVICSEGNCSFYECGSNQSIISLGHSVLAWNHPGFGASSENNAVYAVILYAIEELGFNTNKIILYGWSIGGYSAAFGAALFPSVDSVVDFVRL
ncbi:phosphatidylserine lipase ABHD16A-like [Octopus sinensis]|uniref:Phosphatidylserine lipase ABHD16A-like n=1 Tax=Octopus sinensis TaxID=2607531 RepID=A0A6P7U2R3_9MOLL|nr:phosphatidylserine lipase ABHD16A-like [Octopus sinensis]